jgi:hypothetical protein
MHWKEENRAVSRDVELTDFLVNLLMKRIVGINGESEILGTNKYRNYQEITILK